MRPLTALFCAALLAVLPAVALAETAAPAAASLPSRIELHPVSSLTLSDSQFLAGAKDGKPVTIAAELRLAQAPGRQPVVVLMHGSSGIVGNIEPWVEQLNGLGIATLVVDGFTGRGLTSTSSDQSQLGRLNFIVDIYRSLEILAKHPRIDTSRVALMGFSRGGQAALYASLERFHALWNQSGVQFAAYLPFYPDCSMSYIDETKTGNAPIRIFHGADDDYDPVASCAPYIDRLKAAGRDVTVTTYAGGEHGFDLPFPLGRNEAPKSQTLRACAVRETEPGVLINTETKAPFTYKDACVQLGPHAGGNVEAAAAVHRDVAAFLIPFFHLK